jgi:hypothetical protein
MAASARLAVLCRHIDTDMGGGGSSPPAGVNPHRQLTPAAGEAAAIAEGLHGLTETQRIFFETKGFLVVPDMLSTEQVGEMNDAFDRCPEQLRRRDWSDARGKLSADAEALVGSHGRADTGELMSWPEPYCNPFRRLLTHLPTVRILLDLVGAGFHHSSANGIVMDAGAEGHTLHGGGGGPGSRASWTYTCDKHGNIECNLITVMYQLADINPGDGGVRVHAEPACSATADT